ncbi:Vms1/Ankzf1 family peptidyl-tRNA hydrolase [Halobacterium hubeiense]|uniref:Vms1/Ankzf1 family peptidyl-tRNA hydrolase n=1 Tax=Halobacterium hubeiense TaxID=1407499 RepID=UPI003C79469A
MLDRLLGRASLKERIEELEAEKQSLQNQLDAESERRSEAVRDKQEAEQRVNELEDRVTELEDRVRRQGGEGGGPEFRGRRDLRGERRERVVALLDSLETTAEGVLTAYVPDDPPEAVREAFGDRAPLVERAAPCLAVRDREGLVSAALRPPNPPGAFATWDSSVQVDREWLAPTGRYALAVVRADLFALGVFEAADGGQPERVRFEGFESDVKGKHSKGGFSQDRFERRRESQIREHLEKCQRALDGVDAERVFVVGEGTLLDEFDADATAAVDATGKPEDALEDAHDAFWTVPLSLL